MTGHVWRPGRIGTLALPHRIVMGAMHLGIEAHDGPALADFYAERARGGAGLIVTGGASVNRVGVGGPGYSVLTEPDDRARLAAIPPAVHAFDAVVALQLFHAGRYAKPGGARPVAPSAVHSRFTGTTPDALTDTEIARTIADFADGAAYAREAGFDAVEVMASEGYLLNQFVSPVTNLRDDEWGGDAARRMRFPIAVLRAIRERIGVDFPVIFRISGADLMPDSSSQDEIAVLARTLAGEGVDALNVGVGWHESSVPTVQTLTPPGVWVRYASAIKQAVGELPVIASNRVNTVELADQVLAGGIDYVSMARPFLADPELVSKARGGREVNLCVGCNQACIDRSLVDERVSCMVNPHAVPRSDLFTVDGSGRSYAVIGGGPAGLSAARELGQSGARVTLFEAESELGGQFRLARLVPGKADYDATIRYYESELRRLGVTLRLGHRIGTGDVELLRGFDGVVVASGTRPRSIDIPGSDCQSVVDYVTAFLEGVRGRDVVIIGGGGISVDLAHLLTDGGPQDFLREHGLSTGDATVADRRVTILTRSARIGTGIGRSTRWAVLSALRRHGVELRTGVRYREIVPAGVVLDDGELIAADTVVIAAGQDRDPLPALLDQAGIRFSAAGAAAGGRDAVAAFEQGMRAARAQLGALVAAG